MIYFIILALAVIIVSANSDTSHYIAILVCLIGFLTSFMVRRVSVNVYSDPIYIYKNDQGFVVEAPEDYDPYRDTTIDGHLVYKLQIGVCNSFWTYREIPIYRVYREYFLRMTTFKSRVKKLLQDAPDVLKDLN